MATALIVGIIFVVIETFHPIPWAWEQEPTHTEEQVEVQE